MTPFAWLCIGHLIGDWMLQNDWMARDKRGRPWGAACLTHCLVYTATLTVVYALLLAWPPGAWPLGVGRGWAAGGLVGRPASWPAGWMAGWPGIGSVGLFAALIFLSHWLIDGANLPLHWGQWTRQTENPTVRLVVDQTMHVIVLALVAAWMVG